MKKLITPLLSLTILMVAFTSCEKDEVREVYGGGTAPVLTASIKDSIGLNFNTETDKAVAFTWTNPNYFFASGISSQNVNYTLQMDTTGKGFASANMKAISISKDLGVDYTQKAFNILMSDLKLKTGKTAKIDVRIVSDLGSAATKLVSNTLSFKLLPYAPPPKVPVPTNGTLWVTGSAFASGWSNPLGAPYDVSQKFTKISDTQYELVVTFIAGGNYKIIQENGVWGTQYHKVTGDAFSGTFEKKDADPGFDSPGAGVYKIVVDFQAGTFTVTKQ